LSSEDRNRLTTILALMMGVMTALLTGIFVPVLEALGGETSRRAWTIMSIGIAGISLVLLLVCFLAVKEKLSAFDQPDQKKNAAASKGKSTVKESLTFLLKSKYFYIIVFLYLTMALTNGSAGINIYFMRDVLGDANLLGIFSLVNALAMILMMPFVPKLFSALGKRKTLIIGLALTSLAGIVRLMFPTVLIMQLVTSFFTTFFIVPLWIASPTMICDLVDYGDWRRGIRTEGFTTSASSFGNKLGTGLGSLLLGVGLSLGGYDGLAATQSPQSINAIILIMIGLPLLLSLLCLAGILIWDLDKTLPQVEAYMNEKKAKEAGQENNAQSSS
jgi:GPH family glycoside/pentoside/hexuronide:cation symporter